MYCCHRERHNHGEPNPHDSLEQFGCHYNTDYLSEHCLDEHYLYIGWWRNQCDSHRLANRGYVLGHGYDFDD